MEITVQPVKGKPASKPAAKAGKKVEYDLLFLVQCLFMTYRRKPHQTVIAIVKRSLNLQNLLSNQSPRLPSSRRPRHQTVTPMKRKKLSSQLKESLLGSQHPNLLLRQGRRYSSFIINYM